jgi:hypothetical protein
MPTLMRPCKGALLTFTRARNCMDEVWASDSSLRAKQFANALR